MADPRSAPAGGVAGPAPAPARTRPGRILGGALALLLLAGCDAATTGPDPDPLRGIVCDPAGSATVDGRVVPAAPDGFVTVENRVVDLRTCEPHRFVGVSFPGLHYSASNPRLEGEAATAEFERMRSWGANVVRITVSQLFWVPTAKWYDPAYPARVDEAVRRARAAGLDVILALQTSDRGDPAYPGETNILQPLPDVNHSIPFWRELAARYADDGRVVFELFSEPFPSAGPPDADKRDWDLWLNGGLVPGGIVYEEFREAYQAAGMQRMYEEVRAAGAENLVILGGTHWGYFLDGVPSHEVRGHNLMYSTHPWDWDSKQPDSWEEDWGFLADSRPVIVSEFGDYSCNRGGYTSAVLDYADRKGLSWVAWAWIAPAPGDPDPQASICQYPMLLADWGGTPSATGQVVKDRLASY